MSDRSRRALYALSIVAAALTSTGANAYTQMFVFGDSLSDAGNAAAMTTVAPDRAFFPPSFPTGIPFPPGPTGLPYSHRFSNGPVAAEYLATQLGIGSSAPAWPATTANSANTNYAVGGAMTGVQLLPSANPGDPPTPLCCNFNWLVDSPGGLQADFPAVRDTGLNSQIDLFGLRLQAGEVSFAPASTLFMVWGGPNDIFLSLALASQGLDPTVVATAAALNMVEDISDLAGLGATHFLVPNMPDLGATPFAASVGRQADLTGISLLFNGTLAAGIDGLQAAGLDIVEFDTFKALDDLIDSGAFANTTTPCFDGMQDSFPTILAGCPGYLFFDSVHPTTAVHEMLAGQLSSAVPEPDALVLVTAALLAMAWTRRMWGQGRALGPAKPAIPLETGRPGSAELSGITTG
jgi:phospholipase/lecithinase/hemolysin